MKPAFLYSLDFPNGKKYIGLTINPHRRAINHLAKTNAGQRFLVNAAIKKYGLPVLRVLCVGSFDYIKRLEVRAIEAFQAADHKFGYNLSLGEHKATLETRAKISAALMGHPAHLTGARTPEARAKAGASNRGKIRSPETRAKISAKAKGRPRKAPSEETRAKQSAAMKGRTFSAETLAKISAAAFRRPPPSPETRAKMSVASKGHVLSAASRAKLSASKKGRPSPLKGRPKSPEHRAKLIAALLRNGLIASR